MEEEKKIEEKAAAVVKSEEKKANMFEEDEGTISIMRFGFFFCLVVSLGITVIGLGLFGWFTIVDRLDAGKEIISSLLPYVGLFLITGFSGKSAQKLFEKLPEIMVALAELKKGK